MENSNQVAFEIIACSGEAMSEVMNAMDSIGESDYNKARNQIELANKYLIIAHKKQTELLVLTAQEQPIEISVILIHAQDHLMNAILAITMVKKMVSIFERKESNG